MRIANYAVALVLLNSLDASGQTPTPTPTPDALQILEKVNSFYSSSFSQLMTWTVTMLGFAGVVLPIALQMFQTRAFRREQKTVEAQIAADVAIAKRDLQAELDKTKQELDAVSARFTEQASAAKGTIFFLQAIGHDDKGEYAYAAADYAYAARKLFEGKDEQNSQRSIQYLLTCLPNLSSSDFITTRELDKHSKKLLETLHANNQDRRHSNTIDELETEIAAARKRSKPSRHED
jgi:hypothetical protein